MKKRDSLARTVLSCLFFLCLGTAAVVIVEGPSAQAGSKKEKKVKNPEDGQGQGSDVEDRHDGHEGEHPGDTSDGRDGRSDECPDPDEGPDRRPCPPCVRPQEGGAGAVVQFRRGPALDYNIGRPDDALGRPDVNPPDPKGLVSLGMGGEIVLRFNAPFIVDGPGDDFTVIEGTFGKAPPEKARFFVSRGRSGPFVPIRPHTVRGNDLYHVSFDLREAGLDCARLLRIEDDGDNSAGGNGFDLDTVWVRHGCEGPRGARDNPCD